MKNFILKIIAVIAIASVSANAAVQITGVNSTDATAYAGDISGTDLANGQGVSIWNNWHTTLPVAGLTDGPSGTIAWALDPYDNGAGVMIPADWHWTLDTTSSPDGYDITGIQSISSWAEAFGWSNQAYTVFYTTVDEPTAWTVLASVNYQPFTDSQAGATKVNITDDAGGVLLTGVDKIWIHFAETTSSQPGTLYDEVDIFGAPTVTVSDPNLPTVDAGVDMVTWSGESVTLAPTVVNNHQDVPQPDLVYSWTADPADGVVFTPGDSVEAPTVTITKATDNPSVVTLTLSVNNVGSTDIVTDTVDIYVYDDACKAAQLTDYNPGDINTDCKVNLEDFALMAADWLTTYVASEPVVKP